MPDRLDGILETQPVSLASVPSHAVTNAGTFAVQNTAATPAGTNNIGDVDIASIAAGDNNIGNVDVVTLPVAFNTGTRSATTQRVTIATDDSVPVTGTFFQATQPVSVASLPLPSGAATSANQLPDGHNVTVDNASGASAVNIQDGGNSITVDGTVAATQSGTWTEANSAAIKTAVETIDNAISGSEMQVDVITMPTTTVTATNLDIRDLTSATDSVTAVQPIGVELYETTTPLAGLGSIDTGWLDVTNYDFIEAIIYTTHNSASNGAVLYLSADGGTTAEKTIANTIVGGVGAYSYNIPLTAFDAVKIVYSNGATPQTGFHVRVVGQKGSSPIPLAPIGATIDPTLSAMLTRAILAGVKDDNSASNLSVSDTGYLRVSVPGDVPIEALSSIKATQATIATTATQITTSPLAGRKSVTIKLKTSATQKVYIGHDNTVTTSTGYELAAGEAIDMEIDASSTIYGIADTSSQTVCILEAA